ncbi:MAG: glycosyltransferase [Phycisphaeraceae bacterium]|nr:glycosyltransferase [Phycisphaeraceae bacterium]
MTDSLPTIAHGLHRLDFAGAEILAVHIARNLRQQFRFVFFCLDGLGPLADQLRAEGFTVANLERRPGFDLALTHRLGRFLQQQRVNMVHAHQYTPFFYAALSRLRRSATLRGLKDLRGIVFTEHGRHYPDPPRPKRIWANKVLLRPSDRVTAVGQFIKQALIRSEGIDAARIDVIHNGIDPRKFALPDAEAGTLREKIRAELGITANQPVVLQVARLHPVKDHATALRAMAHVKVRCPNAVLLLAGDGELRSDLEKQAAELGTAAHVRFLGVRTDIPALMAAADVFVLSSLSEGISVTLLEAMAAGLPIAATDVGGNGEIIEHGITGLLSPRSDSQRLADNVLNLLEDAPLRRLLGEAGLARQKSLFDQDQMHLAFAQIYRQVLA